MTHDVDQAPSAGGTGPLSRTSQPYRREGEVFLIELNLSSIDQLFDLRDPSPFLDRDLDPDAEEYLLDCAREIPRGAPVKILIHCPQSAGVSNAVTGAAIAHFFEYRRWASHLKLREHFRRARVALITGVLFLAGCLIASEFTQLLSWPIASRIVSEGLFIVGWVALWHPAELLLYGWWPLKREERLHARLAQAPVEVRSG